MYEARSFRRFLGILAAGLVSAGLAASVGCATGGSETAEGGGGLPEDGGGSDTPHHSDGSADTSAPPLDTGLDTTLPDTGGGDTGHHDSGPTDSSATDTSAKDVTTDGKPKDTGPPKDVVGPDTAGCVSVTVSDAGAAMAACPAPTTGSCAMGSISTFTPSWIAPTGYHQALCKGAGQIDAIYTGCLGPTATTATCTSAQTTDPKCYACIFSTEGTGPYGPVINTSNGVVEINQAGCIDLLEPCNLACAEAAAYASQCESVACETNCPVKDTTTFNAYQTCVTTAATCNPGGCDAYYNEYSSCYALLTGTSHPASVCVGTSSSTFKTLYDAVVPVFCGP